MNRPRFLLASLLTLALAVFPSAALAGAVVPPGNSAANQYTETFPTAGGNAEAKKGKGKVTAADVIGAGNAHKLDSQGKQGREVAAVVTATAPPPAISLAAPGGGTADSSQEENGSGGAGPGSQGGGNGGGQGTKAPGGTGADSTVSGAAAAKGSSGFGEVLGQATGAGSEGGTGLLLPLALLATVAWAAAFLLRRRHPTA